MKKFFKVVGTLAALAGLHVAASAASFQALSGTGFTTETGSAGNMYLLPVLAGSTVTSYSVLSTLSGFSSTGTLTFAAPVTSYTFLWGSPDTFNTVSDGTVSVTGATIGGGTGNGDNSKTTLYTFSDAAGFSTLTFTTTGVAFELAAVSPVPEPSNYALMLAGLGVAGFAASRRQKS